MAKLSFPSASNRSLCKLYQLTYFKMHARKQSGKKKTQLQKKPQETKQNQNKTQKQPTYSHKETHLC